MIVDDALVQLYMEGDRIGAPFESYGPPVKPLSYGEIMARANEYPNGTDESDIVRCFSRFTEGYTWADDLPQFIVDWCDYHEQHRAATSYGGTWRDHFATVKYLRKEGKLTYGELARISEERDSFGCGALALVYPALLYAEEREMVGAWTFVTVLCKATHHHVAARAAVMELLYFFSARQNISTLTRNLGRTGCRDIVGKAATLAHLFRSKQNLAHQAILEGGDVDSILSLALLLWGMEQKRKVEKRLAS